jgi:hypothetical protein
MMMRIGIDPQHINMHFEAHAHFLEEVSSLHTGITPENQEASASLLDYLAKQRGRNCVATVCTTADTTQSPTG